MSTEQRSPASPATRAQMLCFGALALFAVLHPASMLNTFRMTAGLHRWLMTYSHGYHRRGLVGTIFQLLVGGMPRAAQIEVAWGVSVLGTYLWLGAALALFMAATARVRSRSLRWVVLAFAAVAFVNPMWTTRAFDNDYLDWLAGLAVVAALAAYACGRPVLSGAIVAIGIVAYWGTIFVWLPLALLMSCSLVRAVWSGQRDAATPERSIRAALSNRNIFSLLLPPAAALLSAVLHDNDAAIAELTRIGGQEHIIRETFTNEWGALRRQVAALVEGWNTYLALAAIFSFPPALCAGLWTCVMRRCGLSLFRRAWLDAGVAVLATLSPSLFLIIAFDLSRLMAWTYLAFFVVVVFWLYKARPTTAGRTRTIWPWTVAPLAIAAIFWTTPTIYAWVDQSYLIPCVRFCFKEHTPQARAMDFFRRRAIASPIWEYSAPGSLVPGATGLVETNDTSAGGHRVGRAGRDQPGTVMDINIALNDSDQGVTVRGPAQTQRAVIGSGPHRISISYRAEGTATANAETRFMIYSSTWSGPQEILVAELPPSRTEFTATITAPPNLAGNMFRWMIHYDGRGTFALHQVSFHRVDHGS